LANGDAQFAATLYDAEDGDDLVSGIFASQVLECIPLSISPFRPL
jgi:hypothetical protein